MSSKCVTQECQERVSSEEAGPPPFGEGGLRGGLMGGLRGGLRGGGPRAMDG